jgi:cholesterol oxidase
MTTEPAGITFRETMTGPFALGHADPHVGEAAGKNARTSLSMHAAIEIRDLDRFVSDPTHTGDITGEIDFEPLGTGIPAKRGVFRLFSPTDLTGVRRMVYELAFEHDGQPHYLAGYKEVRNDRKGTDLWNDTTTLFVRLHQGVDSTAPVVGAGVLRLGVPDLLKLTTSLRIINAVSPADQASALATFGGFFLGSLWGIYGPKRPM